jgi:hypothetical protein
MMVGSDLDPTGLDLSQLFYDTAIWRSRVLDNDVKQEKFQTTFFYVLSDD